MTKCNILIFNILMASTFTFSQPVKLDVLGSLQLLNDADIFGLDQIIGWNDIRLYGDQLGGPDLFIHANGNIGIGTASPSMDVTIKQRHNPNPWGVFTNPSGLMIEHANDEASLVFLSRFGNIMFAFGSGNAFTPKSWISNWNGDYYIYSDQRLKKNIENLFPVLHKLLRIRPSYYYLKDDINERRDIGFIAQDVEVFFPEVVSSEDGLRSISYGKLSVLAVKAIQEQQQKIEQLKEHLLAIKTKLKKN